MNRGNVSIALLALFVSVFVHREDVSAESPRLGGEEITSAGEAEATLEVEKSVAEVESPESPANEPPEYYRNATEMDEAGTALKETRTGRNAKIYRVYHAVRWPGDAATFPVIQMREERAADNWHSTLVLLARTTAGEQELDRAIGYTFVPSADEVIRPLGSGGVHIAWNVRGQPEHYRHLLLRLDENGDVVVAQKWHGRSHTSKAPDWTREPGPEAMMLNLRKEVPAPNYFLAATEIPANGAWLQDKHLRWPHDGSEFPVLFQKQDWERSEVVLLVRTASGTKRLARYGPGSHGTPLGTLVLPTASGALILITGLNKGGGIWAKAVIGADGRPVVVQRWRGSGHSPKRPAWTKPQGSDEAIAEAKARLRETQQADDLGAMKVAYEKLRGLNPPATVLASLSPELIERATTEAEVAYRHQNYYTLSEAASALQTFGAPPSVMAALAVQIDELDLLRRFSEEAPPGPLRLGMTKSEAKSACQGEGKFTHHESGFAVCSRTDGLKAYALGYCGTVACLNSAYWIPEGEELEFPADLGWADAFSGYFGKGTSRKNTAERVTTWKIDSNKSAEVKVIKVGGFKLAAVTVEDLSLGDSDDRGEDRRVELARMHKSFATEEEVRRDRRARILRERPYCSRYKNVLKCPKFYRDHHNDCRYENGALNRITPENAYQTRSLAGEPAWCSRPCVSEMAGTPAARAQFECCALLRERPSSNCPKFD